MDRRDFSKQSLLLRLGTLAGCTNTGEGITEKHKNGLKFGVWLIRGIPRKAVEQSLSIAGIIFCQIKKI